MKDGFKSYEIEEGISIPESSRGQYGGGVQKYPVSRLDKIGQSFFVPDAIERYQSIRTAAINASKRRGFKVTVRIMNSGVRVWRIS